MKDLLFAFDIGVASVGWSVVDRNNLSVVEAGVNIFPEATAASNGDRRNFRQGRRLKRRQRTRITDFEKLWKKSGFSIPLTNEISILDLRNRGLEEGLTSDEIYNVLRYMLKFRGISYLEDDIDESSKGDYARGIAINQQELLSKYPCQIQQSRLEEYGSYRGNNVVTIDDEKVILRNVFTTSAYCDEIRVFLECQSKTNTKITSDFIKSYIEIFKRKRKYYEGPGNELSRTDYGKYTTKIDEAGNYITEDNIFERLIGKCSVYPEEIRAAASTYTAQEYNALNDLNNLVLNGRKLEEDEKKLIIEHYKNDPTVSVRKIIKIVTGESIDSLTGFRTDKNDKEQYHTMDIYRKMRKGLLGLEIDIDGYDRDILDEIARILTINTEREGIEEAFNESFVNLPIEVRQFFIDFRKKNSSLLNKWSSFSIKIMKELIPELYAQPKNQMVLLTEMGVFKGKSERFNGYNHLPMEIINKDIYNPVIRRSVSITVKVLNALIEKYGYPYKVVIEMPRDKNSDEERDRIQSNQKANEKELSEIIKKIKDEYGIEVTDETFYHHKGLVLKLKLWNEQGGRCVYSGKAIDIEQLIKNQNMFEVDHIIPISISFDDSRANKILVYSTENQKKGNRTPLMYLSTLHRDWGVEEYIEYVKNLSFNSKSKIKNLLYSEDITKIDVVKGFISRNLNDTRYASRVILNAFQDYFKAKESATVVSVVRGTFTHQMRINLDIRKNRDEDYSHHAVDAMLVAFSQLGYDEYRARQEQIIDFETGEILSEKDWKNQDELYKRITYQKRWYEIRKAINEGSCHIKYWHKVDRKCNRSLCNQTIYGTREYNGETYTIDKLNIYDSSDIKRFRQMISKGKEKDFLMYENDPKSFEDLMTVFKRYEHESNPFIAYNKETGDCVRKYSKDHNGPKIEKIKFRKEKTGSCIDISHKYGHEKDSKKVILGSLKPYRMDVYKHSETGLYYLVGIRYSDIKCEEKKYIIDEEAYSKVLINEKMIKVGQSRKDLINLGYVFQLSFYNNDIIEYEKDGITYKERFLSRTMPSIRNYIETKPVSASKFEKQHLVGLSKTTKIVKYVVSILGDEKICDSESFKRIID